MALSNVSQFPRLATPADLPRLISGDRVHRQWPPPGATVLDVAQPEHWVVVQGEVDGGDDGDWWVTDLDTIAGFIGELPTVILTSFGKTFVGPIATFANVVGRWPVIYTQGEGRFMRWIASTFRGTLGGVEQFQFGINWGNPGSDPDPNEAETLAFADQLRVAWTANWTSAQGGSLPQSYFATDVKFTEVGATVKTQTDGTAADGSGGNLEQKFDTQWSPYSAGALLSGTNGTKSLPYEVSCALTLQSAKRGPSGRGRLYLPPFDPSALDVGGRFEPTGPNTLAKMLGAFFEDVLSASGHVPVIVSRRRIVLNEVTSVAVGYVPDSQRRRRRSQDEARTTQWVAA